MPVALLITRLLLAAVFIAAAFAKLVDLAGFRQSLTNFGTPQRLVRTLSLLLPSAELASAVALIPVASAWWGALYVFSLLLLFTAAISINLAKGRKPDCHCFGQLGSSPIGWETLARNGVLSAAALFVLVQGPAGAGASVIAGLGNLTRFESVVLACAVCVAGLAVFHLWFLYHLLRQNGRLLVRLEAVEARVGISASNQQPAGLPVGTTAPGFRLLGINGEPVSSEKLVKKSKPLLLVFIEPGCGVCDELLPEVGRWQRDHADRLSIVLISRGEADVSRAKLARHGIKDVLLQKDREIAEAYQVAATPSGVLILDGKIGSAVTVGPDEIRALVVNATLPPPVKKGHRVPLLRLQDLDARSIDLSSLRGQRTLLLFWNPTCGFCQRMLADLKAWERNAPAVAPALLVISTGSVEANRKQGFRSPVLLDPSFGAGQVFGATGTPSGLMIDEQGRAASEIAVGAQAFFALAKMPEPQLVGSKGRQE